jgi:hypothetical protein
MVALLLRRPFFEGLPVSVFSFFPPRLPSLPKRPTRSGGVVRFLRRSNQQSQAQPPNSPDSHQRFRCGVPLSFGLGIVARWRRCVRLGRFVLLRGWVGVVRRLRWGFVGGLRRCFRWWRFRWRLCVVLRLRCGAARSVGAAAGCPGGGARTIGTWPGEGPVDSSLLFIRFFRFGVSGADAAVGRSPLFQARSARGHKADDPADRQPERHPAPPSGGASRIRGQHRR